MKKSTFIVGIFVALILGVIAGYSLSHQTSAVGAISPVGTVNTSAKYFSQVFSLASAAGTTTSMLNSSGYDFAARSTDVMCQNVGTSKTAYSGTGLAGVIFKIATSSTNAITGNVTDINANYLANVNIGTSTIDSYQATSTEGVIQGTSRIWPNNSYLIISSNATNTASCVVGVSVMQL